MNTKQFLVLAVIVTVTGFAGGMLGQRVFGARPAMAQENEGNVVTSHAFQIQDADGNARIILATKKDDDMPLVGFYDANGTPREVIALSPKGEPAIAMSDGNGKLRVMLGSLDAVGAAFEMYDDNETAVWKAR